jgi:CRISPR-associated protein Csm2
MPQGGQFNRTGSGRQFYGAASSRLPQQASNISVPLNRIVFGEIDPMLYSEVAEEAAKAVGAGVGRDQNKPTQLRRFYDELVALQAKVSDQKSFDEHLPFIQMLKAKVAYAKGRQKVDEQFVALLNRVINEARDPRALKQARLFMEAFMAFYKIHGPREG